MEKPYVVTFTYVYRDSGERAEARLRATAETPWGALEAARAVAVFPPRTTLVGQRAQAL